MGNGGKRNMQQMPNIKIWLNPNIQISKNSFANKFAVATVYM